MNAVPRTGVAIKQCTDFMFAVYREVSASPRGRSRG